MSLGRADLKVLLRALCKRQPFPGKGGQEMRELNRALAVKVQAAAKRMMRQKVT